jgi:hypothetical protein
MQYHMGILRLIAECDRIDAEVREAMQGMTAEELEELEAMTDEEWDEAIREAAGEVFDSIGGSKDHVSGEDAGCRAPFSGS